ncbi:MAG: pilus assembly protein [Chloroflexi bacterium]|nr:pilus assembly protein [Chloroflexota bacterium]
MIKRIFSRQKQISKGQSLVELTLVLVILLSLLTGMVEFGNLLNQYITVVDAAREGARFASNDDPFIREYDPVNCPGAPITFCLRGLFFTNIDQIVEGNFLSDGTRDPTSKGALSPIRLRPEAGDDVVVSFFSIHDGNPLRFPSSENGWSYYQSIGFTGQPSSFPTSELQSRIVDSTTPDTGMVVVEIYYKYDQILKFWGIFGIPDPINVHAYAIMPLTAAEPTPEN